MLIMILIVINVIHIARPVLKLLIIVYNASVNIEAFHNAIVLQVITSLINNKTVLHVIFSVQHVYKM